MRPAERNLRLYPVFQALVFTPVLLPVIVLFWEECGLDLFDVFLLQAIFAVAVVVLEVPTGMVADRLGKRTSLLLGTATAGLGVAWYGVSSTFVMFLGAEVALALGLALLSGADSSLLYDSLKELGRESEYARLEGRARAMQMLSFAASNIAGGLIGEHSYRAAVWASGAGPVLAFGIALLLVEVQPRGARESLAEAWAGYRRLLGESLRFVRKHRLVLWYVAFGAVMTGSSTWLLWLYQPYMQSAGLPVTAFGVAFAGFNLFAAAVSSQASRVQEAAGKRGTLVLLAVLQIVPPLAMAGFVHVAGIALILGHQAARGLVRPLLSQRILAYTYADKRSTVLSLLSMAGRFFFALTAPFVGLAAREGSLEAGLGLQASLLLVAFVLLAVAFARIPQKFFAVKDAVAARQ